MVGGGPDTKSVFHVTRGPASLPSFVNDVAAAIGAFVNDQTMAFAATGAAAFPFASPEGGKEPLQAALVDFSSGSDHQAYTEGSFRIPAVYLNDWPDRYIHTNFDSPANIDPTKLLRAAFIAGATAWVLANADDSDARPMLDVIAPQALERMAATMRRLPTSGERDTLTRFQLWYERTLLDSMSPFFDPPADVRATAGDLLSRLEALVGRPGPEPPSSGDGALVFARRASPKGPMSAFGYDYFLDKYGADRAAKLKIFKASPTWGDGGYDYEALNLVDGRRTVQQIRNALSAIYGPIPIDAVLEYLRALESIGVLEEGRGSR